MARTQANWIKYRDVVINYNHDFNNRQRLLRTRLIIEDNRTDILTPVPDAFTARIQAEVRPRSVAGKPKDLTPRNVNTCFVVNGSEVNRNLINPYHSGDSNHNLLIKQVRDNFSFVTFGIQGETWNSNIEGILT